MGEEAVRWDVAQRIRWRSPIARSRSPVMVRRPLKAWPPDQ
jgi:hypothetical protein